MKKTIVLISAALLLFAGSAFAQSICDGTPGNLVLNCGFETGNFADWTHTGNLEDAYVTGGSFANSGNYGAQLGPVGSDGFLSQTIWGNSNNYVQFALLNEGGTPNDFTVYWNGVDVGPDLVDASAFGYTLVGGYLPGPGGPNTITFGFRQDPAYWGLDDIIVQGVGTPNPEPGTLTLLGAGLLALIARRKLWAA